MKQGHVLTIGVSNSGGGSTNRDVRGKVLELFRCGIIDLLTSSISGVSFHHHMGLYHVDVVEFIFMGKGNPILLILCVVTIVQSVGADVLPKSKIWIVGCHIHADDALLVPFAVLECFTRGSWREGGERETPGVLLVRVCIDWKADEFWILRAFDLLSDEVSFLKVQVRFCLTKI